MKRYDEDDIALYEFPARLARFGNRILGRLAVILMLLIFSYAAFSLWNNYIVNHRAFGSELLEYKPRGNDKANLLELMKINKDVCGWLTIDNTHINYPLLQGNYDYEYLNKDARGEYTLSGSLFLSTSNAKDFSDPYTLIYGHHMNNGAMFGDIDKFLDRSFFEKNRTGTLYTKDRTYKVEIFSCLSCDAYNRDVYSETSQKTKDLPGLAASLSKFAVNERKIIIEKNDHMIAMSTCAEAKTNGRYVLLARIIPTAFQEQGK